MVVVSDRKGLAEWLAVCRPGITSRAQTGVQKGLRKKMELFMRPEYVENKRWRTEVVSGTNILPL